MAPDIAKRIIPVVLEVPETLRQLPVRERVRALSAHAREALRMCALKCGVVPGPLEKGDNGAPIPFDGHYWSLTHKQTYVGAVISREPTGIDIEAVKAVSEGVRRKTADDEEWRLAHGDPVAVFFRYWTAKEAVLKAAGVGIGGLSECRVVEVVGARHLRLFFEKDTYLVEHLFFEGHVASVVKNFLEVDWQLVRAGEAGRCRQT